MAGRKGLKAELSKMLRAVPKTGTISNKALQTKLGWRERTYWMRRDQLIAMGDLACGRGQGGSVYRVDARAAKDRAAEKDYYDPLRDAVETEWWDAYEDFFVEVTAHAGRKDTGGRWSRPDLTLAAISFGDVLPPYSFLDVHTFEVKRVQDANVTAVHEALRHRVAATHAWVVVVVPSAAHNKNQDFQARAGRIADEAGLHGIGFAIWNPQGRPRWSQRVHASRVEPEPRLLDRFLATQISAENLGKMAEWFGSVDDDVAE